jgi:hypothetical protein
MKRLLVLVAVMVMTAGIGAAADLVGYLADEKCAAAGKANAAGHAGCAQGCVKGGQPIAFVQESDGKVYKVHNQDAVKEHVGHKVTITGKVEGDSIHVDSVKM